MQPVLQLLDLLSEFSTVKKVSKDDKVAKYFIPNLTGGQMPDIQKIKKITGANEIRISSSDEHQIVLIYKV